MWYELFLQSKLGINSYYVLLSCGTNYYYIYYYYVVPIIIYYYYVVRIIFAIKSWSLWLILNMTDINHGKNCS